jgi:rhamnogalacturonyl hydrolase YesR
MNSKRIIISFIFIALFIISSFAQEGSVKKYDALTKSDFEKLENRNLKELIALITYRNIKEQNKADYSKGSWDHVKTSKLPKILKWEYPNGVTFSGMQLAYDILNDDKILLHINGYFDIAANYYEYLRWQKYTFGTVYKTKPLFKLWRLNMLDDCGAMGTALLEAVLRHNCKVTPQLKEMINIIGNYVSNVQYRLPDGTFWRPKFQSVARIWADDLYMGLPFLIRWSEYTKNDSLLADAARQIISFASYLQDDKDGIWFHGYYVKEKRRSPYKWGRANGWVAVAVAEVLSALPENHPLYRQVMKIYINQIKGLKKYQSDDGLWHQIIDHPELSFGTETSCSSQFTFAIARGIRRGWLNESYKSMVEKAVKGLKQRISVEGGLYKVCKGTGISDDIEYYNNRATPYDDSHGIGLMLFALTEVYHLSGNY